MSDAMLCIELEKNNGLKPVIALGETYQLGGFCTIPAKACAQWCSTPNAIAYGRYLSKVSGGMRFSRSASTRFMNSWNPSTAMRVRPPCTVFADLSRANNHQISV